MKYEIQDGWNNVLVIWFLNPSTLLRTGFEFV